MAKTFSPAFKNKMILRMIGKDAVSATQLHKEFGVPQVTLSRWLHHARSLPPVPKWKKTRTWTVEEKIRILAEASPLSGEELTAYLDRNDLRLFEVEQWRLALEEEGRDSNTTTRRIRALERELARKEKALAEAAALLILKKKLTTVLEEEDDDTEDESEK